MVFGDGQSNSVIQIYPQTLPGCHSNEIWDKMGYNSASARDICDIFASIEGFSMLGHRMLPMKFCRNPPWLPRQLNLKQKGNNSNSVRNIFKIFVSNG